jgi:uncharacterized DUF497 family protein
MRISFDPNKRAKILNEREIDIADAGQVFEGFHLTRRDDAHSDVETRYISVGQLGGAVVNIVWTEREDSRRIVTMRKANGKEREIYFKHRNRSG